jgi:hypothetical protein
MRYKNLLWILNSTKSWISSHHKKLNTIMCLPKVNQWLFNPNPKIIASRFNDNTLTTQTQNILKDIFSIWLVASP